MPVDGPVSLFPVDGPVSTAAITATAHKIAIIFYTMVKNQTEYDATRWAEQDDLRQKRAAAAFQRQAQRRGFLLVPLETSID